MVRPPWTSSETWLRRTFTVAEPFLEAPYLRVHHDEDLVIYPNGQKLLQLPNRALDDADVPLDDAIHSILKEGR